MDHLNFNTQNIVAGQGFEIAITGMCVVFSVLALLSLFIVLLPRLLALVERKFPEREPPVAPQAAGDRDNGAILAAVAYAMHIQQGHKG